MKEYFSLLTVNSFKYTYLYSNKQFDFPIFVCVTVINEGFDVVPQQSFCPRTLLCAELLACNEEVNKTMRFQIDNLLPIQLWLIVIAPHYQSMSGQ